MTGKSGNLFEFTRKPGYVLIAHVGGEELGYFCAEHNGESIVTLGISTRVDKGFEISGPNYEAPKVTRVGENYYNSDLFADELIRKTVESFRAEGIEVNKILGHWNLDETNDNAVQLSQNLGYKNLKDFIDDLKKESIGIPTLEAAAKSSPSARTISRVLGFGKVTIKKIDIERSMMITLELSQE